MGKQDLTDWIQKNAQLIGEAIAEHDHPDVQLFHVDAPSGGGFMAEYRCMTCSEQVVLISLSVEEKK